MVERGALDDATLETLSNAVTALDPRPRDQRWVSLAFCIADAVWSIGAHYDKVVVPLVRKRIARGVRRDQPTAPANGFRAKDPLKLKDLEALGLDRLTALTNLQKTSTRSGIPKSEAVLLHRRIFRKHGVETLEQAIDLMADDERFAELNDELRSIPGEGGYGVRRGYLWMLIGNDDLIKPDRMVLRWLEQHDVKTDPDGAREIIAALMPKVRLAGNRPPTHGRSTTRSGWATRKKKR